MAHRFGGERAAQRRRARERERSAGLNGRRRAGPHFERRSDLGTRRRLRRAGHDERRADNVLAGALQLRRRIDRRVALRRRITTSNACDADSPRITTASGRY